jgi:hypothetical protein
MNYWNSFGLISVSKVNVENLQMAICEVVPEFDGELAEDVNIHSPTGGVALNKIRELGGECCDLTEVLEKIGLLLWTKCSQEIENFNINEQTGVAHLDSPDRPSLCSHCSGVSQRLGDLSSILAASFAA